MSDEKDRIKCPSCSAVIKSDGTAIFEKSPKITEIDALVQRLDETDTRFKTLLEQMEKERGTDPEKTSSEKRPFEELQDN